MNYSSPQIEKYYERNNFNTNWDNSTIDISQIIKIRQKDSVTPISKPRFENIDKAISWLDSDDSVVALNINGTQKAYPLKLLLYHQIVNDRINDTEYTVTYCPFCNSANVFEVTDNNLEFCVSGLVRNANLIIYDKQTESLWQQYNGEAIVGDYLGTTLTTIPSSIVSFKDFYISYPNGLVLSKETGFNKNYDINPYITYDRLSNILKYVNINLDSNLNPMNNVVSIPSINNGIAYTQQYLNKNKVINNLKYNYLIFYKDNPNILDSQTLINSQRPYSIGVFSPVIDSKVLTFYSWNGLYIDNETNSLWTVLGKAIDGPLKGKVLSPLVHLDVFLFSCKKFYPKSSIQK